MTRTALVVILCAGVGLMGCQMGTAPQTVAAFHAQNPPSMRTTDYNGDYTLYSIAGDRRKQESWKTLQTVRLGKGQPVGFRQRATEVVAVASQLEIPLAPGEYEWVMRADPGQISTGKTVMLVVAIVVVAAAIAAVVIAEADQHDLNHPFKSS